ncbi:MAG: TraR/DksA C4-type zinc finger protein [Candidatus Sumerlaeaceae bacterium]|nr:TraR/DksA C4-type zinc finger protein [Candidatus Sumerlaeaceae bacterium]
MDRGEYGICKGSGEPIELERLRVKPWARYSVKYMTMLEQRNKRSAA